MTIELELEDVSTENIRKMTELLKTDLEKLDKEADEAEKTREAMKKDLFSIEDIGSYKFTCANIDYSDACDALWAIEKKRRDLRSAINFMTLEVSEREGELER